MTGDPALRRIAEDTLDYLLRDLRHPDGAFYSATDADSEGEEGRYFVWTPAEVAAVVDPADVDLIRRYWDISEGGNFEGSSIAHVTASLEQVARMFGRTPEDAAAAVERARGRLLEVRGRRVPPLRDEKILVAWNALAIGTLAEAGRVLRTPRFVAAAEAAAAFLWTRLRDRGTLLHVWAAGRSRNPGYLDDHAFLADALLDLYEASGDRQHVERAAELIAALEARFHDDEGGGYFFTPHDGERLIARSKNGADGSLPSGNAVAARALLRLHHFTGDEHLRVRAEEILRLYHDQAAENPFGFASYLEVLELYTDGPTEVVVVGARDVDDTRRLWDAVAQVYVPHHLLVHAVPGDASPLAPARDRPGVDARATAYVCHHFTCSAPVTDPAGLRALLAPSS